jgi:histidinol dehydrogenase
MQSAASPARLSTASPGFEADLTAKLHWSSVADAAIEQRVADILADVFRAATTRCLNTPGFLTMSMRLLSERSS